MTLKSSTISRLPHLFPKQGDEAVQEEVEQGGIRLHDELQRGGRSAETYLKFILGSAPPFPKPP